ncbi:MAG: fused response regulator/phosphatase [Magnetococcales bacterium]|nr:fused response regulator/phosphatase [Magnetococcales bacterium]MBF0148558.1 fused response regulator/phosphatase [Magnetococcales bacterium]MBF0173783.1 fused response regulator/phosphatase [Magnetococcales bacterium]
MKILIVDDDRINSTILNRLLARDGHAVVIAHDGVAGVEVFKKEQPDLVLMDIRMPRMNGYDAAREIKRWVANRFVPIIFLTAVTDEESLVQCIDAGGDDFLTKPFNRTILQAKIDAMERIRRLHGELRRQKEKVERHQEQLQQEMEVGQHLFAKIVSAGNLLDAPCLKRWTSPMSVFNGDLLVAAYNPAGGLYIMLGDFTGHGLSAAVGAMPLAEVFYEMTAQGFSLSELVEAMNAKLVTVMPTRMFCAACLIEVDFRQKSLLVWNGGLPDVLVTDHSGRVVRRLVSNRLPLGVAALTREDRKMEIMEMKPDHRVFLYSDGLIEAPNADGEMFGLDRLMSHFNGQGQPDIIFDTILGSLKTFRGDAEQSDDISLLEIDCSRAGEEPPGGMPRRSEKSLPPAPWEISFSFHAGTLKNVDPLPTVINAVMSIQAPTGHRERLYTILAELLSNALDHGLLGLDTDMKKTPTGFIEYYSQREERLAAMESGFIHLSLMHEPVVTADGRKIGGAIRIRLQDSGPGFDFNKVQSRLEDNCGHGGRGIALIRSLCSELVYHGAGNQAEVVYQWSC